MNNDKLNQIIYISIPEDMKHHLGTMTLDPSILLPVEIPEGEKPGEWSPQNLSWEMIVSGMLKILAYDPDHKDSEYFREFIISVRPEITAELTQSAVIKAQSGDFDLAEEIFLALIGLNRDDLRSRLNLVLLYENKLGSLAEGQDELRGKIEELYEGLLEKAEDLPDIYFNAAWYYYGKQDFARAYGLCESYLTLGSDENKRSEAEKLQRECSELKDTNELYTEAFRLVNEDKNDEGLEKINLFLEDSSEVWNGWFLKGWALRKLGRFEEAITAFTKASELKPGHVDILNEMAICTMEQDDFTRASALLQEALEIDPENLKIISNMGILCLKEKKMDEAAAFFRTVLALDPEDAMAAQYLDYIENL